MATPPQSQAESRVSRPYGHDAYASNYGTVLLLPVQGQVWWGMPLDDPIRLLSRDVPSPRSVVTP